MFSQQPANGFFNQNQGNNMMFQTQNNQNQNQQQQYQFQQWQLQQLKEQEDKQKEENIKLYKYQQNINDLFGQYDNTLQQQATTQGENLIFIRIHDSLFKANEGKDSNFSILYNQFFICEKKFNVDYSNQFKTQEVNSFLGLKLEKEQEIESKIVDIQEWSKVKDEKKEYKQIIKEIEVAFDITKPENGFLYFFKALSQNGKYQNFDLLKQIYNDKTSLQSKSQGIQQAFSTLDKTVHVSKFISFLERFNNNKLTCKQFQEEIKKCRHENILKVFSDLQKLVIEEKKNSGLVFYQQKIVKTITSDLQAYGLATTILKKFAYDQTNGNQQIITSYPSQLAIRVTEQNYKKVCYISSKFQEAVLIANTEHQQQDELEKMETVFDVVQELINYYQRILIRFNQFSDNFQSLKSQFITNQQNKGMYSLGDNIQQKIIQNQNKNHYIDKMLDDVQEEIDRKIINQESQKKLQELCKKKN